MYAETKGPDTASFLYVICIYQVVQHELVACHMGSNLARRSSVSLSHEDSCLFAAMAQPSVPVQLINASRNYINYMEQRESDLIRRLTELEITCRHLQGQIDFLTQGMHVIQRDLRSPPEPKVNMIPKGPPRQKAPAPPLPDDYQHPEEVGPQPRDMAQHEQYQREMAYKAAPTNAVVTSVMSLNLEVPKLPSGHDHGTYTTQALQPPPVPTRPPQQHPPVGPPAKVPPAKPPPDFLPSESRPRRSGEEQSYIV